MTRTFLLLLGLATLSTACGGGGGAVGSTPRPAFYVASSDPADGQQNVSVVAQVRVTFNAPVDPASVNDTSLRIGAIGGTGEVAGSTSMDSNNPRTVVWSPTTQMTAVTAHSCVISSGLRSTAGDLVEGDLTFSFRTGGDLPGPPLPGRFDLTTLASHLNVGRRSHTATLLGNGQVLIAGGVRQGLLLTDRAELFQSGTFLLLTDHLVQARAGHTATRLDDGRVLLAGGWYEASPGQWGTTEWAEVYDPDTGLFTRVGDMTEERVDHTALLLPDGRVLITGGSRLEGSFLVDLDTAEVFDPDTNTFSALPDGMVHTRATHVMLDLGGGRVLLYGGSDADLRPSLFDAAAGTFTALPPAAQDGQRWGAAGDTFASGNACVAGGDALGTVIYVDADTGFAQNTGSGLNGARSYATATRYGADRILVAGGYDAGTGFMYETCDVVIEGGIAGSETFACEMRFPTPMADHTATPLADGRVLFCGGLNENGGEPELDGAYLFTPPH